MARYIKYERSPGRPHIDGTPAGEDAKETIAHLQVKLPLSEKEAFAAYCQAAGKSMSDVIRDLIKQSLASSPDA